MAAQRRLQTLTRRSFSHQLTSRWPSSFPKSASTSSELGGSFFAKSLTMLACRLGRNEQLFVFVENGVMPVCDCYQRSLRRSSLSQAPNLTMQTVYDLHKDGDGFLYFYFSNK